MDWFEKIKSMNRKELTEFLIDFDASEITGDYCKHACDERNENKRCEHDDCIVEDSNIIEKWLHTKATEN